MILGCFTWTRTWKKENPVMIFPFPPDGSAYPWIHVYIWRRLTMILPCECATKMVTQYLFLSSSISGGCTRTNWSLLTSCTFYSNKLSLLLWNYYFWINGDYVPSYRFPLLAVSLTVSLFRPIKLISIILRFNFFRSKKQYIEHKKYICWCVLFFFSLIKIDFYELGSLNFNANVYCLIYFFLPKI